ncbi:hypothetical protein LG943_10755 [Streptomonospora sp. S1-112]|uniref:Uncharacterized protein n=1 Tax=Streptomonospora mangrovi TaxID=2883123 RepID=A0A9X3NJ44_9ACTN|nr:hypothetical protein [Streptomonospora mangrovi]MDA0564799.1 hypothetical protein [Streptomonospora mangrovi]
MTSPFADASADMFQALAAGETGPFRSALQRVFRLARTTPVEERVALLDRLAPMLDTEDDAGLDHVADLAVLAGALVEGGLRAGPAGVQAIRLLRSWAAAVDTVREPGGRHSVARRLGLAAKTMLTDADVRAAVRADERLLFEIEVAAGRLKFNVSEFEEVERLVAMAGAVAAVVLDRRSGRGFRVAFDGVWSNHQLHTLLADALLGAEGRGLEGDRPCRGCVAIEAGRDRSGMHDYEDVRQVWTLLDHKGDAVDLADSPGDFLTDGGERVIVLGAAPQRPDVWEPGSHSHARIKARVEVEAELSPEEAADRWSRVALPESG